MLLNRLSSSVSHLKLTQTVNCKTTLVAVGGLVFVLVLRQDLAKAQPDLKLVLSLLFWGLQGQRVVSPAAVGHLERLSVQFLVGEEISCAALMHQKSKLATCLVVTRRTWPHPLSQEN